MPKFFELTVGRAGDLSASNQTEAVLNNNSTNLTYIDSMDSGLAEVIEAGQEAEVPIATSEDDEIMMDKTMVPRLNATGNETEEAVGGQLILIPTSLRLDPIYIRVYILWMNLIFHILGPFVVLAFLNWKVTANTHAIVLFSMLSRQTVRYERLICPAK